MKLNHREAVALISSAIVEAARDGRSVSSCMELGKQVVPMTRGRDPGLLFKGSSD